MIGMSRVGTSGKSSKGPRILCASLPWSAKVAHRQTVVKPVWQHFFHSYILICATLPIGFIPNRFTCTFKMFWTLMCQSTCSSAYLLQSCGFQQWSWLLSKVPFLQMSPVVHFPDFHLEIWDSRSKSVVQFSVTQLFKFIICFARNWRNVTSIFEHRRIQSCTYHPHNSQMLFAVYAFQMCLFQSCSAQKLHSMRLDTDLSLKINPGFVSAH